MNERISRQEVSEALGRRLSGLQDDPWLTAKVLSKAEGEKPVKKLSATAILVIVLLVLTMAGALAAALNAWGVIDFAGNRSWTYVPENAQDSVTAENMTVETDQLICTIQDSYYDGEILQITARIQPKEKMLLVVENSDVMPSDNEEECVPVTEYAQKHFDGRLADVYLSPMDMGVGSEGDWKSNEDGSVTVYMACEFPDEQQDRDAQLELGFVPAKDPAALTEEDLDEGNVYDYDAMVRTPVTLKVHAVESETYVCEEPMDFPSVGVQVQKVVMKVTPWEIRYKLDYAITDLEKYMAMDDGLWFEFVDPAKINAANYFEQTFEGGMTGGGSVGLADDNNDGEAADGEAADGEAGDGEAVDEEAGDEEAWKVEVGTVLRQTDSLGLNAKSDEYTVRAYSSWEKTRFESVTFKVTRVK